MALLLLWPNNIFCCRLQITIFNFLGIFLAIVLVISAPTVVAEKDSTVSIIAIESAQQKIARIVKATADSYVKEMKFNQAADSYAHALELAPEIFTYLEKINVAKLLISANRTSEATLLLEKLIKEPHQGFIAELTLANLLAANEENQNVRTAKFYLKAIQLAPQKFNYDEKIAIAKLLIKLRQKNDAKILLQQMVTEPHNGFTAEVTLAKLLASTGEYNAALDEADEILQRSQKNTGALLVKGGALRRRKAFGEALKAYRSILAKSDDFDARLGLVYCLLAIGQKQEAEAQFKLLHAEDEWQQSDLKELARNIDINVRPVIEFMDTRFSDSDSYSGSEQDFNVKGNIYDWDLSFSARHRTTSGDGINGIADTGIFYVGKNFSELLRILAGIGASNLSWQQELSSNVEPIKSFTIGEFRLDTRAWQGSAQLSYTSQVLTANSFLIQNAVELKRAQLDYSKPFDNGLTIKTTFNNSQYTDENVAKEFKGLVLLSLNKRAPQFSIGYGYRYLNFAKPTALGYFDPQDYVSNQLLLLVAYERGPFYLYAEYNSGRQNYSRKQQPHDEGFNHAGITTGTTLWKGLRMELSAEQNNSSTANSDYAYGDSSISWRISYSL